VTARVRGVSGHLIYSINAPNATHTRSAHCSEVDCPYQAHGWTSVVDERTDRGANAAWFIRNTSRRHFREHTDAAGQTVFVFPAGQQCFKEHRVPLDRPAIYVISESRRQRRQVPDRQWVDEFATNQDALHDLESEG
jgi:hypothetical protein